MESTPISGKEHEYKADGDHRPRQEAEAVDGVKADAGAKADATVGVAPKAGIETEQHISEGIPGAGQSREGNSMRDTRR